ncbi:MAG: nicotinate-nucleotide adenylyltransferase [Dehalococcoidales bacterium]|nr:nicotinate-nucleotide adenylyltransferase [Dehalococcoidales bacterium]
MNIGVLGGTFDPIHVGHLLVAEEARARLDLTETLFVPAGQPWLKLNNVISPAEHRVEMVRLAIAARPYFKLSTMEIERAGPTYTVDTIAELQAQLGAGDELFFILGWDNLNQLPQWHEPSRLVKMCRLVAVPRVDSPTSDLDSLEAAIPGLSGKVILLDAPRIDINASEIRRRVARGLSIAQLVPEPVERYIKQHKLYVRE